MPFSKRSPPDYLLEGCHALVPEIPTPYGYTPSLPAGIIFCVLFLGFTALNLYRSIRYRVWPSYMLTLCAAGELIGWVGRAWASRCPYNSQAFPLQEICLVISPVFLAATLYLYLGIFIKLTGEEFSLLKRKWYIRVFLTSDIVSLLVQSAGAGVAIGELGGTQTGSSTGVHIVVGGLVFHGHRQSRSNAFVAATAVGVLAVYIRCIYRTVQLAQGFAGYLSVHEGYFIGLDAIMIVIAYAGFVFYDAGVLDACATKVSREITEVIA
ncbi:RTA1-domain-containing protein [Trichoderma reesei RUT C-30]|uniref:RTA1-domain-containing protein n=1 Tax=Hypocrea jecorina (strain ATCC 56765 / BCRC 32924 / NRRL 11460 / Rut C-30) TaxID=1344414 RepID=A0A024S019_HYPJR|nr:RTA1-domain-containing protein [Trichoderma reesei RUT C-30]